MSNVALLDASQPSRVKYHRKGGVVRRTVFWNGKKYSEEVDSDKGNLSAATDFHVSYLNRGSPVRLTPLAGRLRYLDLFCGGGGLSLGVQNASRFFGRKPTLIGAADVDKNALKLVSRHFKPLLTRTEGVQRLIDFRVDPTGATADFIENPVIRDSHLAQFVGKCDLIVGGPPCQGHSTLNNRTRGYDPRNLLYFVMPATAIALKAPMVIIENVASIRYATENVVDLSRILLESHGYRVQEIILNASDFGVAQHRRRHFLVAMRDGEPQLQKAIDVFRTESVSFEDACTQLQPLIHGSDMLEHSGDVSDENKKRIDYLFEHGLYELPNHQRPICHQDEHTYPSIYGRIHPQEPMTTVTTGFSSPGRGRYIHPFERRVINIREAGRVQGFPDQYWEHALEADFKRINYQKVIGDAVPSVLVYPLLASLLH